MSGSQSDLDLKVAEDQLQKFLGEVKAVKGQAVLAPGDAGAHEVMQVLDELAATKFKDARDTLIEIEESAGDESALAAGRGPLSPFIMRAFRKRICEDNDVSEKVKEALKEAEQRGAVIGNPTATRMSVGAAAVVFVTVASVVAAPFGVVLAPFLAAVTLFLMLVGIDGFCEWAKP